MKNTEHLKQKAVLYLIRLFDEKESFFKIGVTIDLPKHLDWIREETGYKVDVLKTATCQLGKGLAYRKAYALKNRSRGYEPKKLTSGRTLCFTELLTG